MKKLKAGEGFAVGEGGGGGGGGDGGPEVGRSQGLPLALTLVSE